MVCHPEVLGRVMRPIDAVAHVGSSGQRLEPVQKPGRYVKMTEIPVIEEKSLLPTEGRRTSSDVDEYVVHRTVGAADQFGLTTSRTAVHTPNYSLRRPGLRVLDERGGGPWDAEVSIEDACIEGPGEQATIVPERLGHQYHDVGKISPFNIHMEMVS